MITLVAVLVSLGAGFGLGRIKNAGKLKAISTEINKLALTASADAHNLAADVKKHL